MTPRLAVTQEQATRIGLWAWTEDETEPPAATLRLPERPTMPCRYEHVQYGKVWSEAGVTPIPEGTRVRIEYPCDCAEHRPGMHVNTAKCPHRRTGGMISVAFATLSEIKSTDTDYLITLTDIEPV